MNSVRGQWLAWVGGVVLVLLGSFLTGGYVRFAVIATWGEPDQSLLFWYSPFLLAGLFLLLAGAGLVLFAILVAKRKNDRADSPVK